MVASQVRGLPDATGTWMLRELYLKEQRNGIGQTLEVSDM
jgi:hypothetical protein